jgi:hypothetical protein
MFITPMSFIKTSWSGVKHKALPSNPKDAAAVLLARVLVPEKGEAPTYSYPPTNKELQVLSVQVGRTKVFLRQTAYEQLERLRNGMLRGSATKISAMARRRSCYKTYAAAKKVLFFVERFCFMLVLRVLFDQCPLVCSHL